MTSAVDQYRERGQRVIGTAGDVPFNPDQVSSYAHDTVRTATDTAASAVGGVQANGRRAAKKTQYQADRAGQTAEEQAYATRQAAEERVNAAVGTVKQTGQQAYDYTSDRVAAAQATVKPYADAGREKAGQALEAATDTAARAAGAASAAANAAGQKAAEAGVQAQQLAGQAAGNAAVAADTMYKKGHAVAEVVVGAVDAAVERGINTVNAGTKLVVGTSALAAERAYNTVNTGTKLVVGTTALAADKAQQAAKEGTLLAIGVGSMAAEKGSQVAIQGGTLVLGSFVWSAQKLTDLFGEVQWWVQDKTSMVIEGASDRIKLATESVVSRVYYLAGGAAGVAEGTWGHKEDIRDILVDTGRDSGNLIVETTKRGTELAINTAAMGYAIATAPWRLAYHVTANVLNKTVDVVSQAAGVAAVAVNKGVEVGQTYAVAASDRALAETQKVTDKVHDAATQQRQELNTASEQRNITDAEGRATRVVYIDDSKPRVAGGTAHVGRA